VPTVSVNLSPTCFHDPKLAGTVAALIRESGLKACELTIEITEEVLDTTRKRCARWPN
jgi:EAL domain-containing protein (putative c-di-GMP-specific phosphodiesterase class I)